MSPALLGISPPPPRIIHLLFSVLVALFLVGPRITPSFFLIRFSPFPLPLLTLSLSLSFLFSFSGPLDVPLILVTSLSFPSTRSNVLVARGSSVRRPSCIPEPPHCSFLEGKRENISARRRRDEASRRWKDRAWKMARRERWRGESRGWERRTGPTVEAAGPRKKQVGERERQADARQTKRIVF